MVLNDGDNGEDIPYSYHGKVLLTGNWSVKTIPGVLSDDLT